MIIVNDLMIIYTKKLRSIIQKVEVNKNNDLTEPYKNDVLKRNEKSENEKTLNMHFCTSHVTLKKSYFA